LGRLPLYFSDSADRWSITRNILSLKEQFPLLLDQQSATDALVFGFTLGSETLYKGISRIAGGTVLSGHRLELSINSYHQFNYEEIKDYSWNENESMKSLIELFTEGIKNRIKFSDLNIVPLSGGMDSRTVAAGFRHSEIDCRYISFEDASGNAVKDLVVAEQIAEVYNGKLEICKLPVPKESDFELFFEKKAGMNYLDMAFISYYFTHLAGLSARPAMFTGDGGDKVFPDLTPMIPRPTISLLKDYALYSNQRLPVQVAKNIMCKIKYSPTEKVLQLLNSYPEKSMPAKYIHFLLENRVGNWLTEGKTGIEDSLPALLHFIT
jgi:asparagine synthase (glutamine-hydrolysing)